MKFIIKIITNSKLFFYSATSFWYCNKGVIYSYGIDCSLYVRLCLRLLLAEARHQRSE